ncbi:hypothetical protein [Methanolobus sp.]|uniref:hypothetical protein n=1 Tax=Methanolobus sp. TaxID=1874737 RepID=UPI0025D7CD16|nr:hypothetical protein [Methanolobus sp.]
MSTSPITSDIRTIRFSCSFNMPENCGNHKNKSYLNKDSIRIIVIRRNLHGKDAHPEEGTIGIHKAASY